VAPRMLEPDRSAVQARSIETREQRRYPAIRNLLEPIGQPAFAVVGAATVRMINSEAATLLGCGRDSALGRSCWEVAQLKRLDGSALCCPDCDIRALALEHALPVCHETIVTHASRPGERFQLLSIPVATRLAPGPALLHLLVPAPLSSQAWMGDRDAGNDGGGPSRLDRLTSRELEVLPLIASGLKTAGVAAGLRINEVTVRNHLQSIYKKLGVHSRLEAALVFIQSYAPRTRCGQTPGAGSRQHRERPREFASQNPQH